jgi:N6-adenosine-specific RNA methylase IME4
MGRKSIYKHPMTAAQRQRRRRAKLRNAQNQQATTDKRVKRAARLASVGIDPGGCEERWAPGDPGLFTVIYADPPWRFEPYSRDTGLDRAPDRHYQTMTLAAIKAMQIPAAADSVLFLWAITPMLPQALEVMDAWGFDYASQYCWIKAKIGLGYWTRGQHELLLIGTRGHIPAPAPGEQFPSAYVEPKNTPFGGHSRKPAYFAEIIERQFPGVTRLELFSRSPRQGWTAHGDQLPQQENARTESQMQSRRSLPESA